jgi:hypothetical protein
MVLFFVLIVPSSRFISPFPVDPGHLSPVTWLSIGLAICCLIQVAIDIVIQYLKNKRALRMFTRSTSILTEGSTTHRINTTESTSGNQPKRRPPRPTERSSSLQELRISEPIPLRNFQ